MRSKAFTRFFLPAALGALFAQSAGADGLALVNCNVFDGVENGIRENATLLVSGDRIERIADRDDDRPDGYEVIDCAGHYLAPGLIDVHTHLDNPEAMRRALDSGTTTVRSASVPAFQDVGLREKGLHGSGRGGGSPPSELRQGRGFAEGTGASGGKGAAKQEQSQAPEPAQGFGPGAALFRG